MCNGGDGDGWGEMSARLAHFLRVEKLLASARARDDLETVQAAFRELATARDALDESELTMLEQRRRPKKQPNPSPWGPRGPKP